MHVLSCDYLCEHTYNLIFIGTEVGEKQGGGSSAIILCCSACIHGAHNKQGGGAHGPMRHQVPKPDGPARQL